MDIEKELRRLAVYGMEDFLADERFRAWVHAPTPEGDDLWMSFIEHHPEKREELESARQVLLGMGNYFAVPQETAGHIEDKLKRVWQEADRRKEADLSKQPRRLRRPLRWVAATIAVLVLAGVTWYSMSHRTQLTTITSGFGEQQSIVLSDGSEVQLNANSTLSYAPRWSNGEDRTVWLEGEAFFKVMKQPIESSKFSVITHDLTVEVRGTSFNVRSRQDSTLVFLEEGTVELLLDHQAQDQVVLKPGDLAVYAAKTHHLNTQQNVPIETQASWKDGVLRLKDTPLKIAIQELEVIYGVEIQILDDNLLQRKITTGLPVQDMELAKLALEKALGIQIASDGERLIIQ